MSSAVQRVIETTELLENILFQLGAEGYDYWSSKRGEVNENGPRWYASKGLKTLFSAQRVSRTFHATIKNSPTLLHLLCLQPSPNIPPWTHHNWCPLCASNANKNPFLPNDCRPLNLPDGSGLNIRILSTDIDEVGIILSTDLGKDPTDLHGSWRSMRLLHDDYVVTSVQVSSKNDMYTRYGRPKHQEIECEVKGATIGKLLDMARGAVTISNRRRDARILRERERKCYEDGWSSDDSSPAGPLVRRATDEISRSQRLRS